MLNTYKLKRIPTPKIQSLLLADFIPPRKGWPRIVLLVSPCRSSSSPMAEGMRASKIETLYQPIKACLRARMAGQRLIFHLHSKIHTPIIFVKETFGPYFEEECSFDPVALFLELGIHPAELKVLALMREPHECFNSWTRTFGTNHPGIFLASYEAINRTLSTARNYHVQTRRIIANDLSSELAQKTLASICRDFGLPYHNSMVRWQPARRTLSQMAAEQSFGDFAWMNEIVANLDGAQRSALDYVQPQQLIDHLASFPDATLIADQMWSKFSRA